MTHRQSGFVSILTVLFFTTLISVATLSFARAMVLERQQQLEDELTKSAYNAALTGIEDAKRAMSYCATLSGAERTTCYAALDNQTCPGFNTTPTFTTLGIKASSSGQTSTTSEDVTTAAQGYSCVIVTRDTPSIEGVLDPNSGVSEVYEMRTAAASSAYERIRIFWGNPTDTVDGAPLATNPQANNWGNRPAILRIGLINASSGNLSLGSDFYNWFAVPVASSGVNQFTLTPSVTLPRANVNCNATASNEGYRCYVDIMVSGWQHNYLILSSVYKESNYRVVACVNAGCSDTNRRTFSNVQPTIDSTGYTSGVARRVKVNVAAGSQTVANAIDTTYGFCKDFKVGTELGHFSDSAKSICNP
ncbi:MAG TPA: hypothetical protein PKD68_01000 [Candidatus Saccharibacteria bacterium]|nr:hypothetical protein [Candidatus Saccharibacteria bacterium]